MRSLGDARQSQRVHRRLNETARRAIARSERTRLRAGPPFGTGEIVLRAGVEDDVRNAPIRPLRLKERFELAQRAVDVVMGEADRNEGAVPTPLVGVQSRRWPCPPAEVVSMQDLECRLAQGVPHL